MRVPDPLKVVRSLSEISLPLALACAAMLVLFSGVAVIVWAHASQRGGDLTLVYLIFAVAVLVIVLLVMPHLSGIKGARRPPKREPSGQSHAKASALRRRDGEAEP